MLESVRVNRRFRFDKTTKIDYNGEEDCFSKNRLYLWVLDSSGVRIRLESAENARQSRTVHTNITGGAPAIQGGELWFGSNGTVYVNNHSGRYGGATTSQWEYAIGFLKKVFRTKVVDVS